MRRLPLLAAMLVGLLGSGLRAQEDLGLIDRFGPDGLPFTFDDPLVVGASGFELRLGSMGADACSEEDSGTFPGGAAGLQNSAATSAHGAGTHPPDSQVGTQKLDTEHKAHSNPQDFEGGNNLVLNQPMDMVIWLSAINPSNGRLSRYRLFPAAANASEDAWLEPEGVTSDRGWGHAGTGNDPGDWTGDEQGDELPEIWTGSGGSRPKNLHLDTMGLAYRDVKDMQQYALGIKTSTFENVLTLPEGSAKDLLGTQIDMTVQQSYIEAWAMELMNLDTLKAAFSGNFVADLSGLQLNLKLPAIKKAQTFFGQGCEFDLSEIPVRLGDPVKADKSWENIKPSEYFISDRLPLVMKQVKAKGVGALGTDAMCQGAVDAASSAVNSTGLTKRFADWLITTFMMMDPKIKRIFDKLDDYADDVTPADYEKIGKVSGLAGYESGRNLKTPIDRIALATFERKGNFKPTEWNRWRKVDGPPSAFQADSVEKLKTFLNDGNDFIDASQRMQQADQGTGWRYNNGGTILTKTMMLYGNSVGKNFQPGQYNEEQNITAEFATASRDHLPDILEHFARWWTFIRFDAIDPYELEEKEAAATWISLDLLIEKPPVDAKFTIDWPPPNFNFGRAQVTAVRAGSGGKLDPAGNSATPKFNVDPKFGQHFHGLVSIDPVGRTLSMAAVILRGVPGSDGSIPPNAVDLGESARSHSFGWTPPIKLPDNIFPNPTTSGSGDMSLMQNDSDLRWLQAFSGRHYEKNARFQWLWDFENDRTLDSDHAQHLSEVGPASFANSVQVGSVFVFQNEGDGKPRGRTGFALAPLNEAARLALKALNP